MDRKTYNRLIQAARKISMSWKPRVAAKKKCQIDKALFQCQACKILVYEGKSPVTYDYYLQAYGMDKVIMDNFHMDHIAPVVPTDGSLGHPSDFEWKKYYKRLFCEEENFRGICKICHTQKTKKENTQRRETRRKKK